MNLFASLNSSIHISIHPSIHISIHTCIYLSIHSYIHPPHGSIGEEAINQYFRNTSIGHPIMGQGILLIGWTGLAIAALFLNNLSYLTFGHVGSLLKDRSDIIYEAEDNTTAAYRQLKQQDTTTTDTEKPETGGGIIELNHIYSSPSTVSGKQ